MARLGWNPWATLRERTSTSLVWQRTSGAGLAEVHPGGAEVIVLDPRLGRVDRRAVLAHELVHLERSLLPLGTTESVRQREEFQVRAETVRRLVPPIQLAHFVTARSDVEGVTAEVVADAFDVTPSIAEAALQDLQREVSRRRVASPSADSG